jgi:hypothetical protein
MKPVLEVKPDLPAVLERLMAKHNGEAGAPKPRSKRK